MADKRMSRAGAGRRTPEQERAFVDTLAATGGNIEASKLAAGYSPAVARQGRASLAPVLRTALEIWQNADALLETADKLEKPGVAERIIKGRLADAVLNAEDAVAVQAAHRLGTAKGIALFQPESLVGVAVYQVSPRLEQLAAQLASAELPTIEADQTPDTPSDDVK
jgi:hypothetical protein